MGAPTLSPASPSLKVCWNRGCTWAHIWTGRGRWGQGWTERGAWTSRERHREKGDEHPALLPLPPLEPPTQTLGKAAVSGAIVRPVHHTSPFWTIHTPA